MIKENEETFHTLINRYTCEMLTFLVFMIVGAKVLKADDEPCDNKGCDQDICDYQREQCGSVHCYPCLLKYPSCIGKTDGLNGFPYRPNTPYYINCENQRLKSAGLVWENSVTGNQMFFIKNGCF
ncbi:unnamed protein product [Mytilus coruscus]|uniref:Uncharacterized protein n=1 Tax=Mytilus coruscus TaxID=42192 RepID=A0A6J8EMH4_MYTCO|nr:unnamed protein product [Mytilus coruscus]